MSQHKHTNRLINETSLYLKSHAHQAIDWYPWGNEALEKAKSENKLIFISIGYSACYWSSQMSKTCFSDPVICKALNDNYISIKIDKEERPDIDQFYFNAVQLMVGSAGWPISCFALPDATPVFGGTYFQPNQLLDIILGLNDIYKEDPSQVLEIGKEMIDSLSQIDIIKEKSAVSDFSIKDIRVLVESWRRKFDTKNGGNINLPKFPLPNSLFFLLFASYYLNDESLYNQAKLTMEHMAKGGIYDQLNGGFFRYVKDAEWRLPHFEKTASDTAMMINLFSVRYRIEKSELYKNVIEDSISFLLNEMAAPNGMFYSSVHAENEGQEGEYYLWTYDEVKDLLGDDCDFACDYFGITLKGNLNGQNVLYIANELKDLAVKYNISYEDAQKRLGFIKYQMKSALKKRISPKTDTKIVTAWNCSIARALSEAYEALGNTEYLNHALKIGDYIMENLITNEYKVFRTKTKEGQVYGFLDDYAFVISLFIHFFQITGRFVYLEYSQGLTKYVIKNFFDEKSGMFFYTEENADTPMRLMDFIDKTTPSSNSIMAINLSKMTYLTGNKDYYDIAQQMLNNIISEMQGSGPYVAHWARSILMHTFEPIIAFAPFDQSINALQKLDKIFIPNILIFPETPVMKKNSNKHVNGCYYYPIKNITEKSFEEVSAEFRNLAEKNKYRSIPSKS